MFKSEGCELLTTEEEYNDSKDKIKRVKIITKCGHVNNNCYVHKFKYNREGLYCLKCNLNKKIAYLEAASKDENNDNVLMRIESNSISIIQSIIEDEFDIERTVEGCLVDIIVKPKNVNENKWLPIQLKSTNTVNNGEYHFGLHREYLDILLILHSISHNKIWLLDGNLVKNLRSITISIKKSIYDNYLVDNDQLMNKLHEYYNEHKLVTKEYANIPVTDRQKKEHDFRLHRENKLYFIKFEYPNTQ